MIISGITVSRIISMVIVTAYVLNIYLAHLYGNVHIIALLTKLIIIAQCALKINLWHHVLRYSMI